MHWEFIRTLPGSTLVEGRAGRRTGQRERSGRDAYNGDSSDLWRILKLG